MKSITFNHFFVLFALISFQQTLGQGRIEGKVVAKEGPLFGVNIILKNTNKGAISGEEGEYTIRTIPPGNYTITASYIGYTSAEKTIIVRDSTTTQVSFHLKKEASNLGEIVISGTMRETYATQSPVKVLVTSPAELSRAEISGNIMDLIGNISGVSTQLNCGVCGTNSIRINGAEGTNTAVLIDGMPILGALSSIYGLNGISPFIIDQVEVIKGPQSTLYGTQALGGVINIITKNPENTPFLGLNAFSGSYRKHGVNIALSPKGKHAKGFLSLNFLKKSHFSDENKDGFNDSPDKTRIAFFGKGILENKNGQNVLSAAIKLYHENRMGGVANFTDGLRGSNTVYGESIYTDRALLLLDYRPSGLDQKLRFKGNFTYHHQDSYYGATHYDALQKIAFLQSTYVHELSSKINLLTGASLRYQTYDDNTLATVDGSKKRLVPSLFVQTEATFGKLTALGGLRLDYQNEHGAILAPRLALKYSPSDRTLFRANFGTGFRLVNVITEDHAALTGSRKIVFAEKLKPERARSFTLGFQHTFPMQYNPLTLSIDGFSTYFSNKIIPDYSQDENLIVYKNLNGHSITRGFSIDIQQNFTSLPIRYSINYTYLDVYKKQKGRKKSLLYSPDYLGNIGLSYTWKSLGIDFGYAMNLVGPKRMPKHYVTKFNRAPYSPAYTIHNLKISKTFFDINADKIGLEAYAGIENIFNFTQNTPLVGYDKPFSDDFDTIYTWGPIRGRAFSFGLRLIL